MTRETPSPRPSPLGLVLASARAHERHLGRLGDFDVWLVHGRLVRDEIEVDFTMGGNPLRYPTFVPPWEIWIDAALGSKDVAATIVHELVETYAMRKGMRYGSAHDVANVAEKDARLLLRREKVGGRAGAVRWAHRFLRGRGIVTA